MLFIILKVSNKILKSIQYLMGSRCKSRTGMMEANVPVRRRAEDFNKLKSMKVDGLETRVKGNAVA